MRLHGSELLMAGLTPEAWDGLRQIGVRGLDVLAVRLHRGVECAFRQ